MASRSAIFRAFVDALTHDPALQALNVTWRSWEEGDLSHQPPGIGDLPWARLSPSGGGQSRATGDVQLAPMTVHVETMTESNDVGRSMDLWDAIEASILSEGMAAAMDAVGVGSVTPRTGAFGVKPHYHSWEPTLPGAIYADGDIELTLYAGP